MNEQLKPSAVFVNLVATLLLGTLLGVLIQREDISKYKAAYENALTDTQQANATIREKQAVIDALTKVCVQEQK